MTSTPTVRPSGSALPLHPSLQQVGRRRERRYLREVRHRRRVQLTRRSASVALGFGIALCGPVLAISASPDAAARRTPRMRTEVSTPRNRAAVSVDALGFQAPKTTPLQSPVTSSTVATPGFGGYAITRNGKTRWVSYPAPHSHPFLVCTRSYESDTAGGYRAVSPDGRHRGAYQFKRSTWNQVARQVGRRDLVGVDPAAASRRDQDWMALYLYKWQGASHWEGRCAGK